MFFDTFELKGVCHEIFELHLFQDSNPSVHLINRLKYFLIRFRFCRDILIFKKLHVCIIPRSQTPGCASYHGVSPQLGFMNTKYLKNSTVCIHGVHTAESDSEVCIPPWESTSKVCITQWSQ